MKTGRSFMKGVNTISDLLSKLDCRLFIEHFAKRDLVNAEEIILIYKDKMGELHVGITTGEPYEAIGMLEVAQTLIMQGELSEQDGEDDDNIEVDA